MALAKLFIGSSKEALDIVDALEAELEGKADIRRWDKDEFRPGNFTLEDLTAATGRYDFAVFVLGRDDVTQSRGDEPVASPRDNVIFEAGLFTAALGRARTYLVVDKRGTKIPSDWGGLGYLTFDASRDTPRQRVSTAARKIVERMQELGPLELSRADASILGFWWQLVENVDDGAVVSLMEIAAPGANLSVDGRSWAADGKLIANYASLSTAFDVDDRVLRYHWRGRHPKDPALPDYVGVGELTFERHGKQSAGAHGFFISTKLTDGCPTVRKAARYRRASLDEVQRMRDGTRDERQVLVTSILMERAATDV